MTAKYGIDLSFLCQQGGISPFGAEWKDQPGYPPPPPASGGNPACKLCKHMSNLRNSYNNIKYRYKCIFFPRVH